MKKGLINTLIFYGICLIIFVLLSKYTYQPAHFFGANFFFLFFLIIGSILCILFHLGKIFGYKNVEYNKGALLIHSCFVLGIILCYLWFYCSQFED
jgi:hypothetical protein